MYTLRRFYGPGFDRVNAIIDSLSGHITSYVNLIGSATLPLPEVCRMEGLPGLACRAEGHRGARWFPGTGPIDLAESLIEEGARAVFGLDRSYDVSGQPHSATQANHAVFRTVLGESGRPVAALSPADGGHISHSLGVPPDTAFVRFPLSDSQIDYDELEKEVCRHRPGIIVAGGTSYTRVIDYARLREIADRAACHLHADLAHTAPFVAGGLHPPAFPFVDSATIDTSKNLRGPRGGVLIYRQRDAREMQRAIFPLTQSSPNQSGLLGKAACLDHWARNDVRPYAESMIRLARTLAEHTQRSLGAPIYGETDTHLLLFDVSRVGLTGQEAETRLEAVHVLANRNQVPGDPQPPWAPSGLRLGTTVLAILGYTPEDAGALGEAIGGVLCDRQGHDLTISDLLERYHRPLVSISSEPTT
ncbi:MAG: glycine hydroxymethyltransferase [Thermoleophilaceae bacterium]|jgi:glycine hydroxymethyltransferase|nr:glycine hydroxymethyltransferase [Thermoleophilaceae bacterium]